MCQALDPADLAFRSRRAVARRLRSAYRFLLLINLIIAILGSVACPVVPTEGVSMIFLLFPCSANSVPCSAALFPCYPTTVFDWQAIDSKVSF
jgi:hypothetical protein